MKQGQLNAKNHVLELGSCSGVLMFVAGPRVPCRSLRGLAAAQPCVRKPWGVGHRSGGEAKATFTSLARLRRLEIAVCVTPAPQRAGGRSWLVGRLGCLLLFVVSAPPRHSCLICICVHAAQLLLVPLCFSARREVNFSSPPPLSASWVKRAYVLLSPGLRFPF